VPSGAQGGKRRRRVWWIAPFYRLAASVRVRTWALVFGALSAHTLPAIGKFDIMDLASHSARKRSAASKGRARKPTNVSLPPDLVAQAEAMKINISKACEAGLAEAVAEARRKAWLEANREAFEFWNDDIGRNGLPLDRYRQF
jgi:antitoxin CcdA